MHLNCLNQVDFIGQFALKKAKILIGLHLPAIGKRSGSRSSSGLWSISRHSAGLIRDVFTNYNFIRQVIERSHHLGDLMERQLPRNWSGQPWSPREETRCSAISYVTNAFAAQGFIPIQCSPARSIQPQRIVYNAVGSEWSCNGSTMCCKPGSQDDCPLPLHIRGCSVWKVLSCKCLLAFHLYVLQL